ncbi:uncharacterized protein tinf2 [Esox lucius]|uniref:TERF1-interacting nuclear factor 2 N-terminal domain-containing protein n=1 Tax=Esox lucius TaxID=8010 RepID=A0A3P8ZF88_ESOLU|nr:uncharacterized protein tinf2 [Esox lucius]
MATSTRKSEMDISLPFSSLRLLAPPLRLVSAAMWKVMKQRDVMHYGRLEEFVTSCCETVPGLLTSRHQAKLALGLRARLILELCRVQDPPDPAAILPHLDRIHAPTQSSALKKDVKIETAVANLRGLVESLLEDPSERELFYKLEFPSEYGPQFERELEKLLWEFLLRLDQLLPVPNLAQTVSWLSAAPPVLEECAQAASQPQLLRTLLQHQVCLGHLDSAASLPPCMGDSVLSSLSLPPSGRVAQSNQSGSMPASVATPGPQSLKALTSQKQVKNKSSLMMPVIGGISNEDLPVMASTNKMAKTSQGGFIIQSDSREAESESREKSKYTGVKSREEDSEDEEVLVTKRGRKRSRNERDGESRRVLRRGRVGEVENDKQSEEEEATNISDGERKRDFLRDSLARLGFAGLKIPEDQCLCSDFTSCLLNQPRVPIQRLPSADIPTHATSQPPRSPGNRTPTAVRSPWGQNKTAVRRLPSTRQRKLIDSSLTLEVELPASADKENCAFPLACSPSFVPLPQTRRSTEMLSSPGNTEEVIGDSEDEATKNFKGRLFVKRYYRTKHNTYVPTLREFWKPKLARRNLLSPGNGHR